MKTLADVLGVPPIIEAEADTFDEPTSISAWARQILLSPEYRRSIQNRLILGELPPALELRMYDYGFGKPPDRLEVNSTTILAESLTAEQLDERAARLSEMARFLRRAEQFDEPLSSDSVH